MSVKTRLDRLERQHDTESRGRHLPTAFHEEPTKSFPHAADGLSRADGETFDQWIKRYQRVTANQALVLRRDGQMQAFSEAEGWHDGIDLFV